MNATQITLLSEAVLLTILILQQVQTMLHNRRIRKIEADLENVTTMLGVQLRINDQFLELHQRPASTTILKSEEY